MTIHFWRTGGDKPPVVLLHGLLGSGACWTPVARTLEHDFDVIMPDARGHGHSSAPVHGYRYEDLARDLDELISALSLDCPALMGHSMGGMTAALLASQSTRRLSRIVLVDPTFLSPQRQQEVFESDVVQQHQKLLLKTKDELISLARARSPQRSLEIIELLVDARFKTSLDAFDVLRPPNPDYRDLLRGITAPTLLVVGDSTPVVTPDVVADLGSLSTRLRVELVRDAGHGLPFDQPQRLGEIVLSFLREA